MTLELMLAFGVASVLPRCISRRSLPVIRLSAGLPAKSRVLPSPSTLCFMSKDPECLSLLTLLQLSVCFVLGRDRSRSSGSGRQVPFKRLDEHDMNISHKVSRLQAVMLGSKGIISLPLLTGGDLDDPAAPFLSD